MDELLAIMKQINKSDYAPAITVIDTLKELITNSCCTAFEIKAQRVIELLNDIIMNNVDFDTSLRIASQGIVELLEGMAKSQNIENTPSPVFEEFDTKEILEIATNKDKNFDSSDDLPKDLLQLADIFVDEGSERVEKLEAFVLEVEKGNSSVEDPIKRILHTFKGEIGLLGITELSDIVHNIETVISEKGIIANKKVLFDFVDIIKGVIGQLRLHKIPTIEEAIIELFKVPEEGSGVAKKLFPPLIIETKIDEVLENDKEILQLFFEESEVHLNKAEEILMVEISGKSLSPSEIDTIFRAFHTIKGTAGSLYLRDIVKITHIAEELLQQLREKKRDYSTDIETVLLETIDLIRELMTRIHIFANKGKPFALPPNYSDIFYVLSLMLDGDYDTYRDIQKKILEEPQSNVLQTTSSSTKRIIPKTPPREVSSIRISVEHLDAILNAIGEAVISQSQVNASIENRYNPDDDLKKQMLDTESHLREVQEKALKLMMIPLRDSFQKVQRLVRDLSKKLNKKVELIIQGEETEIDKSFVEKIGDPLIHMIRNSLDHGLESEEERIAQNKSSQGTISLNAYHKAGSVMIEIEDDGRGLDKDIILKKAIDNGLAKSNINYSEIEIFQFIFMPGFSTAAEITDVSGRGVGMDVVKKSIEEMKGRIVTESTLGVGTKFTIILPLTLSIVSGMVVTWGVNQYVIPIINIIESFDAEQYPAEEYLNGEKMVNLRGDLYPFVTLGSFLEKRDGEYQTTILVETQSGERIAIGVTEIVGEQQVVIKNLNLSKFDLTGISGGVIMADGKISLILDMNGIYNWKQSLT